MMKVTRPKPALACSKRSVSRFNSSPLPTKRSKEKRNGSRSLLGRLEVLVGAPGLNGSGARLDTEAVGVFSRLSSAFVLLSSACGEGALRLERERLRQASSNSIA